MGNLAPIILSDIFTYLTSPLYVTNILTLLLSACLHRCHLTPIWFWFPTMDTHIWLAILLIPSEPMPGLSYAGSPSLIWYEPSDSRTKLLPHMDSLLTSLGTLIHQVRLPTIPLPDLWMPSHSAWVLTSCSGLKRYLEKERATHSNILA